MSNYIRTDVEITVKEGMLDEFRSLTGKMIQNTAAKEPDALVYEWYIGEDGRESHLLETFKDSDAFLDPLWELSTLTGFKTFGNPSSELREALAGFPVPIQYYPHSDGMTRD